MSESDESEVGALVDAVAAYEDACRPCTLHAIGVGVTVPEVVLRYCLDAGLLDLHEGRLYLGAARFPGTLEERVALALAVT